MTLDDLMLGFVAGVRTALPGVSVYDGPIVTGASPNLVVMIGHSDTLDEPGARIEDPADGAESLPEWMQADVITVVSTIETRSGASSDSTIPGLRTDAMTTLATIRTSMKGNSPYGLAGVAWARVGSVAYTARGTQGSGSSVVLVFETAFQSRPVTA